MTSATPMVEAAGHDPKLVEAQPIQALPMPPYHYQVDPVATASGFTPAPSKPVAEGIVERLGELGISVDPQLLATIIRLAGSEAASTIASLSAERDELLAEIEAAKQFGGGFFGPIPTEATREIYRNQARASLKGDSTP